MESVERKSIGLILCILWSPARHSWDRIIRDLDSYCPAYFRVLDSIDLNLSENELVHFIKEVYRFDDIASDVLEFKTQAIQNSARLSSTGYDVRIVKISVLNSNNLTNYINECKESIRTTYQSNVTDYQRDVIIHMTDNCHQGKLLWEALLSNNNYVTIKNML